MIGSRHVRNAALALLAGIVLAVPRPAPAAEPFTINAILSLTGYAGFIGQGGASALHAVEVLTNRTGGIDGRPLHFEIADDQSNPTVALQLANQLVAQGVPAILGPNLTSNCEAIYAQLADRGPLTYCLSPALYPKAGSFGFAGGPSTRDLTVAAVRYFRAKGWTRVAILTTTDASGQDGEKQCLYALGLPENKGLTMVANEHFAVADLSIAAQAERLKAAHPDAILAWITGTPAGTALHGLHDAGIDVPVMLNAGDIVQRQIASYASFASTTMLFPGFVFMAPELTQDARVRRAQSDFASTLAEVKGEANTPTALVYDPARIVVEAFRHLGVKATAAQLRDYIEGVRGFAGIDGMMSFAELPQRGIGENGVLIVQWNAAKSTFVPVSRAGGVPR